MEKLVLLAIAICFFGFVSDVLPSVSAAHLACYTCGTNLLQTRQQCAESNEQRNCSNATACFAATAELANGTHIGIKDCYEWQGNCSQNTACMQGSNQTGVVFQRCYATCCTDVHCNTMLPSIANFTSSTTQGTTSTGTTGTSEPATTSGALSKDIFNRFFLFLTSVHLICFAH